LAQDLLREAFSKDPHKPTVSHRDRPQPEAGGQCQHKHNPKRQEHLPITAALPERPDVAALIERQAAPLRRPIGRVEVPGRNAVERDLSTRRLIARALKTETGADVGLEPAESLFGEWKTGPISRYDVCYALPFPNHAAVVTVKGADLVKALAQPGMAIAGADVGTRSSGPEADIRIAGAALDPQRSYRVVAEDYHAANTPGLKGAPAGSREDVRDLVARWLEKGGGAVGDRR
jgi:2',3'-cyclic-nucleotide 2'-phosphodiesterase (5'-nucleotidase family)